MLGILWSLSSLIVKYLNLLSYMYLRMRCVCLLITIQRMSWSFDQLSCDVVAFKLHIFKTNVLITQCFLTNFNIFKKVLLRLQLSLLITKQTFIYSNLIMKSIHLHDINSRFVSFVYLKWFIIYKKYHQMM